MSVDKSTEESTLDTLEGHDEKLGPRVGVKLDVDQASFILQKHKSGKLCKKLTYINRGFNNRTYIVTSETDQDYIIRISSGKDHPRMKTENEVATITLLSKRFKSQKLPLPKILGYCSDCTKSGIGNEYIFMEKLPGKPLDEIFRDLSFDQKKKVIKGVCEILGHIKSVQFQTIGSLEFSKKIGDTLGEGINLETIQPEKDIFVGPGLEAKSGPFDSYLEFVRVCGNTELKYLKDCPFLLEGEGLELFSRIESFLEFICNPDTTPLPLEVCEVPFVLTHGDFEPRNVLVDEKTLEITGILDFEYSGSFPIDDDWFAGIGWFGADTSEWLIFNEEPLVDDDHFHPEEIKPVKGYFLHQCQLNKIPIPSEMPGHEIRAMLYYFRSNISPWWVREEVDPIPKDWFIERDSARRRLKIVLEKYGF